MPFKNYWQIFPNPGKMCLPAISPVLIGVFLSCNIFTDLYLVSMPIPVLVRAPLRKVQKLSLIFLFGCNVLVTGMAILRAVLLLKVSFSCIVIQPINSFVTRHALTATTPDFRIPGSTAMGCGP